MQEKDRPDHHDAEIAMRVYELRREALMRESRTAIMRTFWPKGADDVIAVTRPEHPLNAAFRQISTYWEMVYGMVRWGIVHPGFFLESNTEGLYLYSKVAPHLARLREEYSATAFRNAEWVATECPAGRRLFPIVDARVRKLQASR